MAQRKVSCEVYTDRGIVGPKGDDGAPNSLSIGTVEGGETASATITGEAPNQTLNLVLPKGDKGDDGQDGADGRDGADGQDGADGNGISSISKTSTSGLVDTYTITMTDGNTTTFDVTNGKDGEDGQDGQDGRDGTDGTDGQDGFSPSATVSKSGSVTTLTVTDKDGTTTATINDGEVSEAELNAALALKQDTLFSGTNIKTVNSNSLLGSGNIDIDALPSQTGQSGKFLTTDGTDASWANVDALPSQTGQSGKFLTTDGTSASWDDAPTGLNAVYQSATETLFFTSGSPVPPLLSHYTFDGSGNLVDCDDKVFLGATGTQYINTGISNSNNNTLNINYKFETNDRPTICGVVGSAGYATNSVTTLSGYTQYAILKTNARVNINFATGSHSLIVSPDNVTYDNSTISWSSDSGNGLSGQICLFTSKWGSAQQYGILKLNRFKIYDSSNVLVRDFIPVKWGMEIGNQTITANGMWDAVNQTFYGNLGSGAFDFHIDE